MAEERCSDHRDFMQSIFDLVSKQQRVSEQTNRLVESLVQDISRLRDLSERLISLTGKTDELERKFKDFECRRDDCKTMVMQQFKEMDAKREENKDRIGKLEQELTLRLSMLRAEATREVKDLEQAMRKDLDKITDPMESQIGEMREKIAFSSGKYGGMVAFVVSLISMLIQWVIHHGQQGK